MVSNDIVMEEFDAAQRTREDNYRNEVGRR
jgi:hypothetical protein